MSTNERERQDVAAEVLDQLERDGVVLSALRVAVAQHLSQRFAWAVRRDLGVGVVTQLESRVLLHALAEYAANHAGKLVVPATPAPQGASTEE